MAKRSLDDRFFGSGRRSGKSIAVVRDLLNESGAFVTCFRCDGCGVVAGRGCDLCGGTGIICELDQFGD